MTTTSESGPNTILNQWTLASKNYVVTGGAKGIGLATVHTLLTHNAAGVLFCSRSPCHDLVEELQVSFPNATISHLAGDVPTKGADRDDEPSLWRMEPSWLYQQRRN